MQSPTAAPDRGPRAAGRWVGGHVFHLHLRPAPVSLVPKASPCARMRSTTARLLAPERKS